MLKLVRLLAATFTLSVASLCAYGHPAQGSWEISGDYLYLLPTVDDTFFVTNSPTTTTFPNGKRENNDFHFHSGYRVGGAYGLTEARQFQVYYTHLGVDRSKTVSGSFLWATLGRADLTSGFENYAGTATSNLHLLYQRVDGLIAQQAFAFDDANLFLNFGMEYAYLRLNEDYEYSITGGPLGTIEQRSKAWGIGPQMGMELDYALCEGFSWLSGNLMLKACSSASLLTSRSSNAENNTLAGASILNTTESNTWRVIPALHARVALTMDACTCWGLASFEVGYEFNSYLRGLTRVSYPDDVADGLAYNDYYNFDVQGLYLSASLGF
ncbi:MAG: Lpg1974 family pore-forming outer membrane protein [Chlamydiales bacterium]|nr:Lpg1974 family pore-forming outer membrane protein [Chlamydiales bacterium]